MAGAATKQGFYEGIDETLRRDIRLSVTEASLSTVMGTFIGGAFLIGFALTLGAGDFEIGLLASLPLLANLIQIAGSVIVARVGSRKKVCSIYLFFHRLMWACVAALPLVVFRDRLEDARVWIFMGLLTVASVCASVTGIAWTSWIADLVPKEVRGRFFSRRNIVAQVVGMVLAVAGGRFIDVWTAASTSDQMRGYGFMILFGIGTVFGIAGVIVLRRISEPDLEAGDGESFIAQLRKPFEDANFRTFMIFSVAWGFATGIVGPFFSVYLINTLEIPFSVITLFGVVAGISTILGTKLWGGLIDRLGPKPLSLICGIGGCFTPVFWIFATPENYAVIWVSHFVSGFFFSGIGLAATGMMMNLAPSRNNAVFFAVFAAVTGLFGALAPIAGGALGELYRGRALYQGFVDLSDIRLLFITSTALRLLSLPVLRFIRIPDAVSVKDMFASISSYQRFLPLYAIPSVASAGMSYVENATANLSRSVVSVERKIDAIVRRGGDLSRAFLFRVRAIDRVIDGRLAEHEEVLDRMIDRIVGLFSKKRRGDGGPSAGDGSSNGGKGR